MKPVVKNNQIKRPVIKNRFYFVLLLLSIGIGNALANQYTCIGEGEMEIVFKEKRENGYTNQVTQKIKIRRADMRVEAISGDSFDKACDYARKEYLSIAKGVRSGQGYSLIKRVHKPANFNKWWRKVACNWARSGKIPGIRYKKRQKMIVILHRVNAYGYKHPKTNSTGWINKKHQCWYDKRPKRTNPSPSAR